MKHKFNIYFNYIIYLIIFCVCIANYNILYCEETTQILPSILVDKFNKDLTKSLNELTTQETFLKEHCYGRLFGILCYLNSYYVAEFVDNLPLMDILTNDNLKTGDEKTGFIKDLFVLNLKTKQLLYDKKILLCYQYIFINYCKAINSTLPAPFPMIIYNINDLLVFSLDHMPLIKKTSFKVLSECIHSAKGLGFTISIDGDSYKISLQLTVDNSITNMSQDLKGAKIIIKYH